MTVQSRCCCCNGSRPVLQLSGSHAAQAGLRGPVRVHCLGSVDGTAQRQPSEPVHQPMAADTFGIYSSTAFAGPPSPTSDLSSSASSQPSSSSSTTTTSGSGSTSINTGSSTGSSRSSSRRRRSPSLPPPCDLGGSSPTARWNAVSLAFLGDAVWEAYLRSHFYGHADFTTQLEYGSRVAAKANTQAQAACCDLLQKQWHLSASEEAVLRWASNSSTVTPPKHASRQQYKQATALEALVAVLYLTDSNRLQQLMEWLLHPDQVPQWRQPLKQQQQQRGVEAPGGQTASRPSRQAPGRRPRSPSKQGS